jgi:hypothetical protein
MQRFEKFVGQFQVAFHPALACGVGQVEVQPEKFVVVTRLLQTLQRLGRIELAAALAGTKTETVQQTEQVRVAMTLVDAVVHEVSLKEALTVAFCSSWRSAL